MATFAVTLDNGSVITFEGNLTGDLQGIPTGWTETGDPADVETQGGELDVEGPFVVFKPDGTNEVIRALPGSASLGFYGASPTVQQTGVAVTAAAIHAALVTLGLITA